VNRALFLAPSAYPLGGVATWLDTLLPTLERSGWEVTLGLTAGKHHDAGRYLALHPWHRVTATANPSGSREGRVTALARTIADSRADLVVVVNVPDAIDAVHRLRLRGMPVRVVLTVHAIDEETIEETRRCGDVLDAVVCTNLLACELVARTGGLEPRRVRYAPYGVDVPPALPPDRFRGSPLRIVHAGRLEQRQKRVFDLPPILQAFDTLGVAWQLSIAGTGPDGAELERRLAAAGLRGRVELLGNVPRAAFVADVLSAADVLLLTPLWETGPIVAWEAMAAGVPVVCSRYIGSGREGSLVHGESGLLFDRGDAAAAAACLRALLQPSTRQRIRAGGFALVGGRYSIPLAGARWHRELRAIAALPLRELPPVSPTPAAGTLDRWLGTVNAERLRRAVARRFEHNGPGGEWPHTYSPVVDAGRFWSAAAALDQRGDSTGTAEAAAAAAPARG